MRLILDWADLTHVRVQNRPLVRRLTADWWYAYSVLVYTGVSFEVCTL